MSDSRAAAFIKVAAGLSEIATFGLVDDAWAERLCEAMGENPDGLEILAEDHLHSITLREKAHNLILLVCATARAPE